MPKVNKSRLSTPLPIEVCDDKEPPLNDDDKNLEYLLTGVISHMGSSADCGHYYAHLYGRDNRWIKLDDGSVTWSSFERLAKETARESVLLIYTHRLLSYKF